MYQTGNDVDISAFLSEFGSEPLFEDYDNHASLIPTTDTACAFPHDLFSASSMLLSPSISPATTLRGSPQMSPPAPALFSAIDSSLQEMYAAMYGNVGHVTDLDVQQLLQGTAISTASLDALYAAFPMTAFTSPQVDAVMVPPADELPALNVSGLRKVLETYVKRQQEEALEKQQKALAANQPRKSKVGRKPKPRPTDPLEILQETIDKRAKNTEAARKSRQKRMEKVEVLESRVSKLQTSRTRMQSRVQLYAVRCSLLERELAYAHEIMRKNGLTQHVRALAPFECPDEVDSDMEE